MKRTIGFLLSLIMLVSLLTGCNGAVTNNNTAGSESSPTAGKSESANDKGGWPRTFVDFAGNKVVIEKKPEKIVSLWYSYPEFLVPLEEIPIASTEGKFLASLAYLKDIEAMKSVAELGDKLSPNIEKIVELDPDIIFATVNHESIYDSLVKIAPVIVLDREGFYADWRVGIRTFGEILGKEKEAETIINDITTQISNGRDTLKSVEGETVALIKTWDGKSYHVESPSDPSYIYTFDKELGLGLTPDPAFLEMAGQNVSMEGLSNINADHIFLEADISLSQSILDGLNNNSVWNSLNAVKKGNVHFLDISAVTGGPLATKYGVKSIIDALSK
ncbi:ABC transporter substrate-binding protein [Clostridium sp. MSJ-4]|uniref:ABC transporter substrate-binding protein n=1 Tax=Clostridium simiarum TaxID=2841506 RepID=A0ABS6F2F5_9CLOT|nr:ABC transporter substrate-binding protein [Clostridium simiarum]MBU5592686.1 ABC transporter substrate-binding protein [Clostridium simiarum]